MCKTHKQEKWHGREAEWIICIGVHAKGKNHTFLYGAKAEDLSCVKVLVGEILEETEMKKWIQRSWNNFSQFLLERELMLSSRHVGWESVLCNVFVTELQKGPGVVSWSGFLVMNYFWRWMSKSKVRKVILESFMNGSLKTSPQHFDPVESANGTLRTIRMKMENIIKNCCKMVHSMVQIHFEYVVQFYPSTPKITWN